MVPGRMERRRSPRHLCSHLVVVRQEVSNSADSTSTAVLEDLSREGAAISLETPLEAGTIIELSAPGLWVRAQVRYCRPREQDFLMGLEFADGFRWEPHLWQPDHLFLPPPKE